MNSLNRDEKLKDRVRGLNKIKTASLIVELWHEYLADKEEAYREVAQGGAVFTFAGFMNWLLRKYV